MEVEEGDDMVYKGGEKIDKPQIPSSPAEIFYCRLLHAKIGGHVCVKRQSATINVRGKEKADTRYLPCSLGRCHQGRIVLHEIWAIQLVKLIRGKNNGSNDNK